MIGVLPSRNVATSTLRRPSVEAERRIASVTLAVDFVGASSGLLGNATWQADWMNVSASRPSSTTPPGTTSRDAGNPESWVSSGLALAAGAPAVGVTAACGLAAAFWAAAATSIVLKETEARNGTRSEFGCIVLSWAGNERTPSWGRGGVWIRKGLGS